MHHGQGQGGVRAGVDGEPFVGGPGRAGAGGVDDDDLCAVLAGLLDEGPQVQVAGEGVAAPDQDQLGLGEGLGFGALGGADGVAIALEPGLGADGAGELAGPHLVEEGVGQAVPLQDAHCAGVGIGQDGLGPVLGDDRLEPGGDVGDGFVPGDGGEVARPLAPTRLRGVVRRSG